MNMCCLCETPSTETTVWRLNEKGTPGIAACNTCRPFFDRGEQSTDDVLDRLHRLRGRVDRGLLKVGRTH